MHEQEQHKRRSDDHWHIKKTVDLTHILTTITFIGAAFFYAADLDKRLAVVENNSKSRDRAYAEMRADIKEIKSLLWEMHSKNND